MDPLEDLLVDVEPLPATADDAEEELEWLSNKDAFPSLEASSIDFQSPSPSAPRLFPGKPRSQGRRRRRRVFLGFGAAEKKTEKRKCKHCETEDTPQWRAGPEGPKTLCNACGVRFKSGRLVPEYRPALSPSFSPGIHSNSHRRILEMRRRRHRRNAAVS
ncbi:Zinc finger NHR/GATA-type protein [Dioscorea alata]|uniref:Zinc finger NHR/GATA-type protein n=1 Tax=Dioscorea alata TaxID=55571 RepID=A0ACB7WRQ7_DIOAL|nr:Zinc finger NHR/GATA-type protein [Dioscorea alata]